jgi:hypothetical protein
MQKARLVRPSLSLLGAVTLGIALGLAGAPTTWSANGPAATLVRVEPLSLDDPAFATLFRKFPNIGLVAVYDTEDEGVLLLPVPGRAEDVTNQPLNIDRIRNARVTTSVVVEYDANPKCKWKTINGFQMLISGDPSRCRR